MLQAAGGAAGDNAEERDGQWSLPVSALRGGAGIPGQLLRILQRLQEGKPYSGLTIKLPGMSQHCSPVTLHPSFQDSVCTRMCMCAFMYVVLASALWREGPEDGVV